MSAPIPDTEDILTLDEFARQADEASRMELVRGRLVREPTAGFEHGAMALHIGQRLREFVVREKLGLVVGAETGFVLFEDPPTVRAPDAAFVAEERLPENRTGYARLAPDLAVEVVSPSNTVTQMQDKVCDFLDAGTRMVWVIDPRRRTVMVYCSRPEIGLLTEDEELDGGDVLPGFRLPVAELFD